MTRAVGLGALHSRYRCALCAARDAERGCDRKPGTYNEPGGVVVLHPCVFMGTGAPAVQCEDIVACARRRTMRKTGRAA